VIDDIFHIIMSNTGLQQLVSSCTSSAYLAVLPMLVEYLELFGIPAGF